MKAKVRHVDEIAVIDLSGKIMIGGGDVVLRDTVSQLLENGEKRILLNLSRVSYMDSAGMGEMFACYKRARDVDGAIKLVNPSKKIFGLLDITQIHDVIDTFTDEDEAIRSF